MFYQIIKSLFILGLFCLPLRSWAQYAPQANMPGSTAIHKNAPAIKSWANECSVQRGWQNIANKSLGHTTAGDSNNVKGMADGLVVSLGDSGVAIVQFAQPIVNGAGFDFAVFENGFPNPINSEEAYLELAFVAVSSDGVNYFTFQPHSLTQADTQIAGAGEYMLAQKINNLAGKYVAQFGTPFDLEELKNQPGLDVQNIRYVRITDVIGTIDKYGSKDSAGNLINDPYPTDFPIGGFDLDAVAVLNQGTNSVASLLSNHVVNLYPNPATDQLFFSGISHEVELSIYNMLGQQILKTKAKPNLPIHIHTLKNGIYIVSFKTESNEIWQSKFCK